MNTQPHSWTPYGITHVEATEDEPRMGFIGRAAALVINGVETIVMCRHEHELVAIGGTLAPGFNPALIYKATLIHSSGIVVVVPEEPAAPPVVPEVPAAPPVVEEEPAAPATDTALVINEEAFFAANTPVRGEDGQPVVKYKTPAVVEEDDDEL